MNEKQFHEEMRSLYEHEGFVVLNKKQRGKLPKFAWLVFQIEGKSLSKELAPWHFLQINPFLHSEQISSCLITFYHSLPESMQFQRAVAISTLNFVECCLKHGPDDMIDVMQWKPHLKIPIREKFLENEFALAALQQNGEFKQNSSKLTTLMLAIVAALLILFYAFLISQKEDPSALLHL
jgi:hypothetical protein